MQTSQLGRSRSHPRGRWLLTQLGRGGDSACPCRHVPSHPGRIWRRRLSSSDLSLRGSYHKVTGLLSSPRHHLGPCLGKLSPTPPVEEQGQPSPARRGLSPHRHSSGSLRRAQTPSQVGSPEGPPSPSHLHPAFGREAEQHTAHRHDTMS